jgi:hypothetical protein
VIKTAKPLGSERTSGKLDFGKQLAWPCVAVMIRKVRQRT